MTSSMLRRQLKNLVQNYSEAEVKVREATSNDPWGPSSTQMANISDLTYNVVACNEIMTMLWKRLKDDKNWRHIHKSLTLLEYLLKSGDDRVMLKMKDNIYIVKALTEFRFSDKDGKDQGVNVREKAKVVLILMEDDEKLKTERDFAVKTREKTSKNAAASSSDTPKDPNYKPIYTPGATGLPSLDNIPSVADLAASFAARKEERLKQEEQKRETERRAKMTEEELKWEDAAKGDKAKLEAWGGASPEEMEDTKTAHWGEPKYVTGLWGAPMKPTTTTLASNDPWGAATTNDDSFVAPKGEDPFMAASNGEGPEDPFAAPTDQPDPFTAPINLFAEKNADPLSTRKHDPFSTPKDASDPFYAAKWQDTFAAPKDKPDLSSAPEDPFNALPDDPFGAPKSGSHFFSAPPTTPAKGDSFLAPTTPPREDPFASTAPPRKYFFSAPTSPPNSPLSTAPASPPKEYSFGGPLDPFGALLVSPSECNAEGWDSPTASPPLTSSDPWGAAAGVNPCGSGSMPAPPVSDADPFGDASKPQDDTWGAPAAAPASADDAWGSSAPLSDTDPSDDPFRGGVSKTSTAGGDPWGAPGSTGKPTQVEETYRKTAAFLGLAGALLVDLDCLLSPEPKPKINSALWTHRPPTHKAPTDQLEEAILYGSDTDLWPAAYILPKWVKWSLIPSNRRHSVRNAQPKLWNR